MNFFLKIDPQKKNYIYIYIYSKKIIFHVQVWHIDKWGKSICCTIDSEKTQHMTLKKHHEQKPNKRETIHSTTPSIIRQH
jgi:competence protein ComGF